jgi:hypothetical protein
VEGGIDRRAHRVAPGIGTGVGGGRPPRDGRVARELEDLAAVPLDDADHELEAAVEHALEFLGTLLLVARKRFGQCRESDDIGHEHGPERRVRRGGRLVQGARPVTDEGGNEALELAHPSTNSTGRWTLVDCMRPPS